MITIQDYKKPTKHPFGMLEGMTRACEAEGFMAWFLGQCIEAGDIDADIKTRNNEDHMAVRGLLEKTKLRNVYRLSEKAKGLLYSHYAKKLIAQTLRHNQAMQKGWRSGPPRQFNCPCQRDCGAKTPSKRKVKGVGK